MKTPSIVFGHDIEAEEGDNGPMKPLRLFGILFVLSVATFVAADKQADPYDQSGVALEVDTQEKSLKKIVLLAGGPSGKPLGHEYLAGCALFSKWLKEVPGVHPVVVKEGWPKNERIFEDAASVVFYMDGGTKISFLNEERWKLIKGLEAQGVGMVFLHQMVDFPPSHRAEALQWSGAVFEAGKGGRGHWESSFDFFPEHEVTKGVTPFKINDGWLYGVTMAEDARERLKPILVTRPPNSFRKSAESQSRSGEEEMISWTYLRKNGGRSYSFTAADWHPNWEVESLRKVTVNGILWTAGVSIPEGGAPVELAEGDLNRNLDDKRKAQKAIGKLNPKHKYLTPAEMDGFVMDDVQGVMKGTWIGSSSTGPVIVGRNYFHDGGKNKGKSSVSFVTNIEKAGLYEIYLYAQAHANRADNVPVTIFVGGDSKLVRVNQKDVASGGRHYLGEFEVAEDSTIKVEVCNEGTRGVVVVDALQVVETR